MKRAQPLICLTFLLVLAGSLRAEVPNTFEAGSAANAGDVNANFSALDSRIATLENASPSVGNATIAVDCDANGVNALQTAINDASSGLRINVTGACGPIKMGFDDDAEVFRGSDFILIDGQGTTTIASDAETDASISLNSVTDVLLANLSTTGAIEYNHSSGELKNVTAPHLFVQVNSTVLLEDSTLVGDGVILAGYDSYIRLKGGSITSNDDFYALWLRGGSVSVLASDNSSNNVNGRVGVKDGGFIRLFDAAMSGDITRMDVFANGRIEVSADLSATASIEEVEVYQGGVFEVNGALPESTNFVLHAQTMFQNLNTESTIAASRVTCYEPLQTFARQHGDWIDLCHDDTVHTSSVTLDCDVQGAGALQAAIDGAPPQGRNINVSGTCDAINIRKDDINIDGGDSGATIESGDNEAVSIYSANGVVLLNLNVAQGSGSTPWTLMNIHGGAAADLNNVSANGNSTGELVHVGQNSVVKIVGSELRNSGGRALGMRHGHVDLTRNNDDGVDTVIEGEITLNNFSVLEMWGDSTQSGGPVNIWKSVLEVSDSASLASETQVQMDHFSLLRNNSTELLVPSQVHCGNGEAFNSNDEADLCGDD